MSASLDRRRFLRHLGTASLLAGVLPDGVVPWSVGEGLSHASENAQAGGASDAQRRATSAAHYWAWWGWEPIDHNRRVGGIAGAVDGSSAWLPQWYDRLHGEELVRTMADLGVNLAITHFYKGFGLKHESPQQQRTAALVRLAHRHGMRVIGYCQANSLYYEALLAEQPQAVDWAQRDPDGRPVTWGGKYYRWSPCIQCRDYRNYLKRVIRVGLEETGLDGFNFDNSYSGPCYCDRCQKAFRQWLAKRYPQPRDLFGLDSLDHVRQPPIVLTNGRIDDPLVRAWVRWRCESLEDYVGELTGYARSLRPEAILLSNPSHPVSPGGPLRRSVWPVSVGRHLNLMIAENAASPEIAEDALITQIRAYKQGTAVGYRAVSTTWGGGLGREASAEASAALPQTPTVVQLQVAEAAANRGVPGANWATRPLAEGDRMRIDRPDLRQALGQYLGFVRNHEDLWLTVRPTANVAILHTFPSLAFDAQNAWDRLATAEEILIRGGFAWEVLFADNLQRLDQVAVVVVAGQIYLSDSTCDALKTFVGRGGGVVLLGENGRYDDEGRLPASDRLAALQGDHVVRLDFNVSRGDGGRTHAIRIPLPKDWKRVADAVERSAAKRPAVRLRGSTEVALSAYEADGDRLAVHLVNYAAPRATGPLEVHLTEPWANRRTARLLTPDAAAQSLVVRRDGSCATVIIPRVDVYGIVVVE
jgi:hypothetical protein